MIGQLSLDVAACTGQPFDIFVAAPGTIEAAAADAICDGCPVRDECRVPCSHCGAILGVVEQLTWGVYCSRRCAIDAAATAELEAPHGAQLYNRGCRCDVCRHAATARRLAHKRATATLLVVDAEKVVA